VKGRNESKSVSTLLLVVRWKMLHKDRLSTGRSCWQLGHTHVPALDSTHPRMGRKHGQCCCTTPARFVHAQKIKAKEVTAPDFFQCPDRIGSLSLQPKKTEKRGVAHASDTNACLHSTVLSSIAACPAQSTLILQGNLQLSEQSSTHGAR
jgi:hypothetical protein